MGSVTSSVETAGEKAYRRLRNDIIFGRLAPSQKLRLEALKEAYGISVSTLRELLNRLTSEGLVVAESALRGRARLCRQFQGARQSPPAA